MSQTPAPLDRPIYLDHCATTPLAPEAAQAMAEIEAGAWGNPSSQHAAGRRARRLLDDAREQVAALLGAGDGARVIFTSGATEANNLALFGAADVPAARLIVSAIEHPSVLAPAAELARRGWQIEHLPAERSGSVDLAELAERLERPARLVALQLGNHETGVVQPVAEAAALAEAAGVPLHCDAAQAAGKEPLDFARLGVASLAVSAHKFHGPRGIGALVLRRGHPLRPLLLGGAQQEGLRAGTEPVALAVGMARALEIYLADHHERAGRLAALRDRFEAALCSALAGLVFHGSGRRRLAHVSLVSFPPLDRQQLWLALDRSGVCCSMGPACASGSSEPSPTLAAMGVARDEIESALRFSFAFTTSDAELDAAIARILGVVNTLRGRKTEGKTALLPPQMP